MAQSPDAFIPRGKKNTWYVRYTDPSGQHVFRSTGTADRTLATEWASKLNAENVPHKPPRRKTTATLI
ncbi:hypothetical protein [Xanthomonas campestris]